MKRRAGFTLLEVLLAISLMSLMTASIAGGVHLGRRAWESSRASESLDDMEDAIRATTQLIGHSFPVASTMPETVSERPPRFLGEANACRFVALSEGGAQWGGPVLTEIGVDDGPQGRSLAVWTKRAREGLSAKRAEMKKTIILEGVESVEFAYFGPPDDETFASRGAPPLWRANWKSHAAAPLLVSVRLTARRLGRRLEVASTVAIQMQ